MGVVTSAVIAFVYRTAGQPMAPFYVFVFGTGQTAVLVAISFVRLLATL